MKCSDLKDKVIVITGATGLIGKAITRELAKNDAIVIIASRSDELGQTFEQEIISNGGKAVYKQLDISSEESIDSFISSVIKDYSKIDVWINNAFPRTDDWMTKLEDVSLNSIRKNIDSHLVGYFYCTKRIAEEMKKSEQGSIINFGSIYGEVAPDFSIYEDTDMTCDPAYPLIKGGISSMTRYMSTYFAKDNIRVNCICPGGIFNNQDSKFVEKYVDRTPIKRMGTPEDIVGITVFLSSDESSYITGQVIMVDGGWTSW